MIAPSDSVDLANLCIHTTLNGKTVQNAPVSDMFTAVPDIIAAVSTFTTLEPGDVILTGSPAIIGQQADESVRLVGGDVVVIAIEGIGIIRNRFVPDDSTVLGDNTQSSIAR